MLAKRGGVASDSDERRELQMGKSANAQVGLSMLAMHRMHMRPPAQLLAHQLKLPAASQLLTQVVTSALDHGGGPMETILRIRLRRPARLRHPAFTVQR